MKKTYLAVYYLLAGDTRHNKNELTTDLSSKLSLICRINVNNH